MLAPLKTMIEELERLRMEIQSDSPARREKGYESIKAFIELNKGKPDVRDAIQLIQTYYELKNPNSFSSDENAWLEEWQSIARYNDARLAVAIQRLNNHPTLAVRMKEKIAAKVESLTQRFLEDSPPEYSERLERDVNAFVDAIRQLEIFSARFAPTLQKIREYLFDIRLNWLEREIETDCGRWAFDEAWQKIRAAGAPDPQRHSRLKALLEYVDDAAQRKDELERCLESVRDFTVDSWSRLDVSIDRWNTLRDTVSKIQSQPFGIPREWLARVDDTTQRIQETISDFLKKAASQTDSLEDIQRFWQRYNQYALARSEFRVPVVQEWFGDPIDRIKSQITGDLRVVESYDGFLALARKLQTQINSLASTLGLDLSDWMRDLDSIAMCWERMNRGLPFYIPTVESLTVPSGFKTLASIHQTHIHRVQQAKSILTKPELTYEQIDGIYRQGEIPQTIKQALAELDDVLKLLPSHESALETKALWESYQTELVRREALRRGDIPRYLALAQSSMTDVDVARLRQLMDIQNAPRCSEIDESIAWWERWNAIKSEITYYTNQDLNEAIFTEERERKRDDLNLLHGLLNDPSLSYKNYETINAKLDRLIQYNKDAETFVPAFQDKLHAAKARHYLLNGRWYDALDCLGQIDPHGESHRTLRLQADFGKARECRDLDSISQLLSDGWDGIYAVHGEDTFKYLLETLEQAWKEERTPVLSTLKKLSRRLGKFSSSDPKIMESIANWMRWIDLEERLCRPSPSLAAVDELTTRFDLRSLTGDVSKWMTRAVRFWDRESDRVMLVWADFVFYESELCRDVLNGCQIDDLRHESHAVVRTIRDTIQKAPEITIDVAENQLAIVYDEIQRWERLHKYLDIWNPCALPFPPIPTDLASVQGDLEAAAEIIHAYRDLREADLREPANQSKLKVTFTDGRALSKRLENKSFNVLVSRIERLQALTKLTYIENTIQRAIERCRMLDDPFQHENAPPDPDLDSNAVFTSLTRCLTMLIEKFEAADMVGGSMWKTISNEYAVNIRQYVVVPQNGNTVPGDLNDLIVLVKGLQREDDDFGLAFQKLSETIPSVFTGSRFNPSEYRDYLDTFPGERPRTVRSLLRLRRYSSFEGARTILRDSVDRLPAWIQEEVRGGGYS